MQFVRFTLGVQCSEIVIEALLTNKKTRLVIDVEGGQKKRYLRGL